jgi:NADPH-dependent 2,4-dienoyl-CoA reductase/sulfur reductase-like enzyme
MATTVAVLGGGVGGLSAAHELAERGFAVTVYEKRSRCGSKARSYPTPDGFPAEHGFRFFPGFYRHLPDTMARIPAAGARVVDRLVGAERILLARAGGENEPLRPLRLLDRALYRLRRPPLLPLRVTPSGEISTSLLGRLLR